MDTDLATFLACRSPEVTESVVWGKRMRLRAAAYLSHESPSLRHITSVRAVVLRDDLVLVQQDRDSRHIFPGGRREDGEPPEATLRREVGEETGWLLGQTTLLGFRHFHHLDPKPQDYAYPYPDFVQLVYAAEAAEFSPETKLNDGYEVGSEFRSVAAAHALALTKGERIYLNAALKVFASLRRSDSTPRFEDAP